MLILIEDTERGMDVAKGIWGAFNSCLYVDEGELDPKDYQIKTIIDSCEKSKVNLIFITSNMYYLKHDYPHAFCIYCDGGDIETENDKTLVFNKEDKRDNIVTLIITYFKRKKLL